MSVRMGTTPADSIRLFDNPILEALTHVNPITPALVWLPIVFGCYYFAFVKGGLAIESVLLASILALLFWTLSEYLIHRFLFHWRSSAPLVQAFTHAFHGIHHDRPNDRTRLLMPPVGSLFLGSFFFLLFFLVLGPVWVFPSFGGFSIGYLLYDYTHFFTHFSRPRTEFGKFIKKCHMEHHFVSDRLYYGVSSPFWDAVFRTNVRKD